MALKKQRNGHKAGDEVRWINIGMSNWSAQTGILKGWDDDTLEWVVKTNDGSLVRADGICDEQERKKFFNLV